MKALTLIEQELLQEDFRSTRVRYLGAGADATQVDAALASFKELKSRQRIAGAEADIDRYSTFASLQALIASKEGTQSKRQQRQEIKVKGAELVADLPEWLVYRITTHAAAQYYGSGTKWCISTRDPVSWDEYARKGHRFLFFISKNRSAEDPLVKVAKAERSKVHIRFTTWVGHLGHYTVKESARVNEWYGNEGRGLLAWNARDEILSSKPPGIPSRFWRPYVQEIVLPVRKNIEVEFNEQVLVEAGAKMLEALKGPHSNFYNSRGSFIKVASFDLEGYSKPNAVPVQVEFSANSEGYHLDITPSTKAVGVDYAGSGGLDTPQSAALFLAQALCDCAPPLLAAQPESCALSAIEQELLQEDVYKNASTQISVINFSRVAIERCVGIVTRAML